MVNNRCYDKWIANLILYRYNYRFVYSIELIIKPCPVLLYNYIRIISSIRVFINITICVYKRWDNLISVRLFVLLPYNLERQCNTVILTCSATVENNETPGTSTRTQSAIIIITYFSNLLTGKHLSPSRIKFYDSDKNARGRDRKWKGGFPCRRFTCPFILLREKK